MRDEDKSKEQLIRELQALRAGATNCHEDEIENAAEDFLRYLPCRSRPGIPQFSSRLVSAQEKERKRISCELHDGLGSLLTAIKVSLENVQLLMVMGKTTPASLDTPIHLAQLAIQEIRTMIMDLRPPLLDDLGLIATINWLCRQLNEYSRISVEKTIEVEEELIPEQLKIVIFRVVQEAFHNVVKHSGTKLVELKLISNKEFFELTVEDHGVGFDTKKAMKGKNGRYSLGLCTMKERTESSGGLFSITSVREEGTTIQATWPKRPN